MTLDRFRFSFRSEVLAFALSADAERVRWGPDSGSLSESGEVASVVDTPAEPGLLSSGVRGDVAELGDDKGDSRGPSSCTVEGVPVSLSGEFWRVVRATNPKRT